MSKFSNTKFDKTFWIKWTKQKFEPHSSLDFLNCPISFILKLWAELHQNFFFNSQLVFHWKSDKNIRKEQLKIGEFHPWQFLLDQLKVHLNVVRQL